MALVRVFQRRTGETVEDPSRISRGVRAREDAGDVWAQRALQVALEADPGTAVTNRLKFDAIRWYASKLAPKVYGDKMQHTGDGGGRSV